MIDTPKCELCGEPMPPGETMFKFHGYSGPCPKPPLPRVPTALREKVLAKVDEWGIGGERELALAVAAMVAEACARECEDLSIVYDGQESEAASRSFADICRGARKGADRCAAAIRQRADELA